MLTVHDIIQLPHVKKPVIIRKMDRTSSQTIKHTKPIYPTKKTIKRRDPNDNSFSLEEFSNSNLSHIPLSSVPRKSPFRKSSSLEIGKHSVNSQPLSPRSHLMQTLDMSSESNFAHQVPIVSPISPQYIPPRARAGTSVPQSGEPPQIFLSPESAPVFQPQPIVHAPVDVNTLSNLSTSLSTSYDSVETDSETSHLSCDARDISNDATIKLPR